MVKLPEKTKQEIMAGTRDRLLQAALVEFARQGYSAANINSISLAAGCAKGTIYNYFPSKRDLALKLIDTITAAHQAFILPSVQQVDDPSRRLEVFFRQGYLFAEKNPDEVHFIVSIVFGPDDEFKQRTYQAYEPLFSLLIDDILKAGADQGEFSRVDPDLAAAVLMSVYLGSCSQLEKDQPIWLNPAQVSSLLLDGLRRRSGR